MFVGFNRDVQADVPNVDLPNTTPALRYSSGVNTPAFSEFFEVRGFPDELMLTVHRNGITKINTLLPNNQI